MNFSKEYQSIIKGRDSNSLLVHEQFAQIAQLFGNKIAIKNNDKTISYNELLNSSNQLANYFLDKGIKKGDVVGIMMERSINLITSMLALIKIGAVYLPLDSSYPSERLDFMLEDSNAQYILTQTKFNANNSFKQSCILIEDFSMTKNQFSSDAPIQDLTESDLIYILYTSGSTGKPKGVLMNHSNIKNYLNSIASLPGINANDIILGTTTISFDISALEIYLPLTNGAQLILLDDIKRKDGRMILDTIINENITIIQATPSSYRNLLEIGWNHYMPIKVFCSGEPLSKDLSEKILPICDELWNMYGPTETTIHSTIKKINKDDELITIGRPIDNTIIYILDENLKPVPNGEEGEIVISGMGVSSGYLNRKELNIEKFLKDPFAIGHDYKMYLTGDLGKILPNGEIFYIGRKDNQVKLRGFRIELGEIEYALNNINEISESVVLARENNSDTKVLIAYVKLNEFEKESIQDENYVEAISEWKGILYQTLPDFMVPSNFIIIKNFPKTSSGKIDKNALPWPIVSNNSNAVTQMDTVEETLIMDIWKEFLGLKNIAINDNFFELGGNSLIAIQVLSRIEKSLGIRLQLSILFEYPTIQKLASHLNSEHKLTRWKSLVPIKPFGNKPPIYSVHGGGLGVFVFKFISNYLDVNQPVYGLQALGINGFFEPLETIEEMAEFYIHEILQQNNQGPYILTGHSAGGIIAFEMAKRLTAKGKEVKFLGIFDYDLYDTELLNINYKKNNKMFNNFFPKLFHTIQSLIEYPDKTMKHLKVLWKLRFQSILKLIGIEYKENIEGVYLHITNSMQKFDKALTKYKLEPYQGTIHLFVSKIKVYYQKDSKFLGWIPYATKGVIRHEVPGDHDDMILPPNDKKFASILQECVDNA